MSFSSFSYRTLSHCRHSLLFSLDFTILKFTYKTVNLVYKYLYSMLIARVTIVFHFFAHKYRIKRVLLLLTSIPSFLYFLVPRLTVKNIENLRYKKRPVIHKCTRCGKGYQLETSLRRHQRLECGVEPRQSCQICGKKFTHRFKLTHHLASCRRKREYYGTI